MAKSWKIYNFEVAAGPGGEHCGFVALGDDLRLGVFAVGPGGASGAACVLDESESSELAEELLRLLADRGSSRHREALGVLRGEE